MTGLGQRSSSRPVAKHCCGFFFFWQGRHDVGDAPDRNWRSTLCEVTVGIPVIYGQSDDQFMPD